MPTVTGKKVLSYLPLLNYTDLSLEKARELAASAGRTPFQVRALNGSYDTFKHNDTVTMRIDLNRSSTDDLYSGISKRTKRYLKDVERTDIRIEVDTSASAARTFYSVFKEVMHRLGTPAFPIRLFEIMPEHVDTRFYLAYLNNRLAAAATVIYDTDIAWVPWSGTFSTFLPQRPGLALYWQIIRDAFEARKTVFDYGRSGFEAGTYEFKVRWGAKPVKIDILSDSADSPYEKYELASKVWQRLPPVAVDLVGPTLCKFLPDL